MTHWGIDAAVLLVNTMLGVFTLYKFSPAENLFKTCATINANDLGRVVTHLTLSYPGYVDKNVERTID